MYSEHAIVHQSFAVIDREIGSHPFSPEAYQILRRVIHSTADFDFKDCLQITEGALPVAIAALQGGCPIITDVGMVAQGIRRVVSRTFQNPLIVAVEEVSSPLPNRTLTETGILACCTQYPTGLYVIGNAPTALLALSAAIQQGKVQPACVVGVPVGFINVIESKQALAKLSTPQIRTDGRKGGSSVAAAIVNALLILAWEKQQATVQP